MSPVLVLTSVIRRSETTLSSFFFPTQRIQKLVLSSLCSQWEDRVWVLRESPWAWSNPIFEVGFGVRKISSHPTDLPHPAPGTMPIMVKDCFPYISLYFQKFKTVCHQITCSPATCANPSFVEGECCPSCSHCKSPVVSML